MSQETEQLVSRDRRLSVSAKNAAVAVLAASSTTILELSTTEIARLGVEVKNSSANAFDAFVVQGKFHKDGNWVTLYSAGADFSSPTGLLIDASGDLTVLAAGASGWLILDVLGLFSVRIQASVATADGTCDVYARGE